MILAKPEHIAHCTAQGWWGTQTLDAQFRAVAARHPQREAVLDPPNREQLTDGPPRRLTSAALAGEVGRRAALLHAQGLRADDIVIVQLIKSVAQYSVYLACLRLGLIVWPVPVQYREFELQQILGLTGARAVVTASRVGKFAAAAMWCALAAGRAPGLQVLCFGQQVPPGALALDAALAGPLDEAAAEQAAQAAQISANHIATLCWTSGTEANPKGVPRSPNEWAVVAPSIIEAADLQPRARLLNPFPLVNMAGRSTCIAAWLALEGTVVQHHPFDLAVFLQQLRDERIDYTVAPPAILNLLLQQPQLLAGIDFKRLWRIGSGSAPLSAWMVAGWAERGVQIVNYFGSNEGAALTGSPRDIPDPALRAQYFARGGVGQPHSVISSATKIRTWLADPDTDEPITVPGVPGELRVSGPTIFAGYVRTPEQTARAFDAQGGYRTGDLFEIAGEHGQFYRYVGRCKDIIVRGGQKISALEVETLLLACPGVADVAVVGQADAQLGERLCACVVAAPSHTPTLAQLVEYLRSQCHVAVYKLPEHLLLLPALPRNPVGKVLKRDLRDLRDLRNLLRAQT